MADTRQTQGKYRHRASFLHIRKRYIDTLLAQSQVRLLYTTLGAKRERTLINGYTSVVGGSIEIVIIMFKEE